MQVIETSGYFQLMKHPTSNKLLVICSSLDTRHPKFTFWKLAQKLGCNLLFLNSPMSHWYRTGIIGIEGGVKGVSEKIGKIKKDLNIEETIFFGVSMGGYGAILLGSLSNADHIIAFSVEPLLGIPGGRTEVTRNKFQSLYPDLRNLNIPKITLIYGEMDIVDTIGAYLIGESCPHSSIYKIPYAEHDVANSLNYRGELIGLLMNLIYRNGINNKSLVNEKVPKRTYEILHHLNNDYKSQNWKSVIEFIDRQGTYRSKSLLIEFIYGSCKYKVGEIRESKEILLKLLEREPQCPHAWNLLASCEYRHKNYESSISYSNVAINLKPAYSLFHMTKSLSLSKLGMLEEAYSEVKISGALNPRHAPYLEEINKLAKALKISEITKETLEKEKSGNDFLKNINNSFDNNLAFNTKFC
ncbi:hypothetical protein C5Y41_24000 [Rahnella variigena]|uniref:tetratricopeptide repeat protein n=1 Tax=Rahnella variigena TaxID=574964 RepID=UPI00101D9342|nr:tetratricopeptide repeat protein [Rahnella variigena]RYJ12535.1 hypothetical protein C5Y41_24000 [Rahnella variigena]